jgi:hypothetical protein
MFDLKEIINKTIINIKSKTLKKIINKALKKRKI